MNSKNWKSGKAKHRPGHGGVDHGLIHYFLLANSRQDGSLLRSTIDASRESHLLGFMAEESRLHGGKVLETKLNSE